MDFINKIVSHKTFGVGTVIDLDCSYITVSFPVGEKKFTFPDVFTSFIKTEDEELFSYVSKLLSEKQQNEQERLLQLEKEKQLLREREQNKFNTSPPKRKKEYRRQNIAFKCNFCDGGKSDEQIGFNGVCSDNLIYNNIEIEHRTWCNSQDCPCLHYHLGEITRNELDAKCEDDGFVCYESQMLRAWKALAGIVQNGENKDKPMKLRFVQANSLCILTTRDPQSTENKRYIFAAFLVDATYEGDGHEEGYVSTNSEFKIKLSPNEAHSLLFWNYHSNDNHPEVTAWNSGLHRYFEDVQAAQILKDIALIKKGTKDEELADKFYKHFCLINKVNIDGIFELNGALKR